MSDDSIFKWIFGGLSSALGIVVVFLSRLVVRNREDNVKQTGKLNELEKQIAKTETELQKVKADQLTQESVREVIEAVLDRRDRDNAERRKQWDTLQALQIKQAVMEGVNECQTQTKKELQDLKQEIVRDVVQQTARYVKKKE